MMSNAEFEEALSHVTDAKHLTYIEARVQGMKPNQAARMAGYTSKSRGSALEQMPVIAACITAHQQGVRKAISVTHDDITKMLMDALPMVESATEQVQVALALSKHMGFEHERTLRIKAEFEKNINITGTVDINTVHTLTEEQLLRLAGFDDGDEVPWIEGSAVEVGDG
jgi:phage terminase small subunit